MNNMHNFPVSRPPRIMWLLNHTAARRFEVPMFKRMGVNEIFLPKTFPSDPSFRSASVDWSEDPGLTIPASDLAILNDVNWYDGGTREGWEIANKHFDIVFFIVHTHHLLEQIGEHFRGLALWRAYGLQKTISYDLLVNLRQDGRLRRAINKLGRRFFLAEAYPHIADKEPLYLKSRRLYLPLGISNSKKNHEDWKGDAKQLLFVCPDIAINEYYEGVYNEFKRNFGDLPHIIGGAQPLQVNDSSVLGFVSAEQHAENMTRSRVMYYHSTEPNHVHYHPFEAIQAGMPLLYMAGGLLDTMGGANLPGRCQDHREARRKLNRVLDGDWQLVESIRSSQTCLLSPMSVESCSPAWKRGFAQLQTELAVLRQAQTARPSIPRPKRIAVCLPIAYDGGTLRGAKTIASALLLGSQQAGEPAEIVLLYPEDAKYQVKDWHDLPSAIATRTFTWRLLNSGEARRAMHYAGFIGWKPFAERFLALEDGVQQLQDCDLWLFVSDRLSLPVLPLRPHIIMVYDYLQRYQAVMPAGHDREFLEAARRANRIWVTTRFTRDDALQYAGVSPEKVRKLPMLALDLGNPEVLPKRENYFVWPTNVAMHKNHANAASALHIYYHELDGQWDCWITGLDREALLDSPLPHLQLIRETFRKSKKLRKNVRWKGNLDDCRYRQALASASAVWLPTQIDNGSFTAIEAAQFGVPSLSACYPAMHEINEQFSLNLTWMDADDPRHMAKQLKQMEQLAGSIRRQLCDTDCMSGQRLDDLAADYWQEARECL